MPKLRAWPFLICHASCVAVILLTACATPASPVEVAPPRVMTVVVTPIGNANGAPATSEAPTTVTASPSSAPSASSYPAPLTANITAVYQPFERGFMIYLSDRQAVWVFVQSFVSNTGGTTTTPNFGAWLAFADTFKEGDPETDPSIIAPAGFLQPKRGFGKVWREHPEVRDAVGWGLDYERPYTTLVADYSIGVFDSTGRYLPQSFIHTVATIDGTLVHVDEAARVWSKP
ncbi:MAG: hypothetical protein AAB382_08110 [Chloroflexota bacterium]